MAPGTAPPDFSLAPDRAAVGLAAENLAARFLEQRGLTILLRNYRRRFGELDIVALDGEILVIVEVRCRASDQFGGAAASVDGWKQRKIVRAARLLLQERRELARLRARFDVITVDDPSGAEPRVQWIRHAFLA
jgi:putative endonuclease